MLSPKTTTAEKEDSVYETTVFKTLDIRHGRPVSPKTAPAFCLGSFQAGTWGGDAQEEPELRRWRYKSGESQAARVHRLSAREARAAERGLHSILGQESLSYIAKQNAVT